MYRVPRIDPRSSDQPPNLREILKKFLPKFDKPLLFRNLLRKKDGSSEWNLLNWSIPEFAEVLGDQKLTFRIGNHNKRTCGLQHLHWSLKRPVNKIVKLTMQEFVNKAEELDDKSWLYCDYQYIGKSFTHNPELVQSLNWAKFGMDGNLGRNGLDSTMWIGSKGSHTDCHYDTYGYNMIAQIYGRKQWLIYPPGDSLVPVRLPYEESTVYSIYNIYCLTEEEEEALMTMSVKPKLITLEPGDVLFVPNGWWHYVECLDNITVSVNIWGYLDKDHEVRVREALVKLLVAKVGDIRQRANKTTSYTKVIEYAINNYQENEVAKERRKLKKSKKRYEKRLKSIVWTAESLAKEYPSHVKLLEDVRENELKEFLQERRRRDQMLYPQGRAALPSENDIPYPQYESFLESIINAICHPDVMAKAAKVLLERHF